MTLRPYQSAAIDAVLELLPRRVVLTMPTGAGKTVTAVAIVQRLGERTLWIAHRRELIAQAAQSLARLGLDVGVIMAGARPRPNAQVQVASIQTLAKRDLPDAGLVVVDECHHARATTYRSCLDTYSACGVPVIGLTATPFRLDGRGLGDIFDELHVACYADELCADGTLVEPVVYAPSTPDLSHTRVITGDYDLGQAAAAMEKKAIVGDILKHWSRLSLGRRTVLFSVNVEHSQQLVGAFVGAGVRCEHLDGRTPAAQRDAILHRLRIGYTTVVSNCQVLTEGWDLPALETAIIARPTASKNLHLQMIGRIMRAAEGKAGALVLDHAGNHLRLGTVTQRIAYTLDDQAAPVRGQAGSAPMKTCPSCFLVVSAGCRECECGHVFRAETNVRHVDGELVEFVEPSRRPRPSIEEQQVAWEVIEGQRMARAYREGWSFHRFEERFGFRPLVHEGRVCDPATVGHEVRSAVYRRFAELAVRKGFKPGYAAVIFKGVFGRWPNRSETNQWVSSVHASQ